MIVLYFNMSYFIENEKFKFKQKNNPFKLRIMLIQKSQISVKGYLWYF